MATPPRASAAARFRAELLKVPDFRPDVPVIEWKAGLVARMLDLEHDMIAAAANTRNDMRTTWRYPAALPTRPDRHQRMVKCRHMLVVCAARRSPTGHRRPEKFGVDIDEHPLVIRQPIVGMDCGYRTHGFAQPAVDALRRVDIHGASSLVDAIDRTDV
jgi:hypothetical protein